MLVDGKVCRSLMLQEGDESVKVINQNKLPFEFEMVELSTFSSYIHAISSMIVRGAPLIGITAAYGVVAAFAKVASELLDEGFDTVLQIKSFVRVKIKYYCNALLNSRPTAVNLSYCVNQQLMLINDFLPSYFSSYTNENSELSEQQIKDFVNSLMTDLKNNADLMCEHEVDNCRQIGLNGLELIRNIYKNTKSTVNILTHCNAGWLATVDYGTALAPVYMAFEAGIPVHVWVDETRPRNQGSRLTSWELSKHGVPCTVIADNAGGYLMNVNKVDLCIVGADRVAANGDTANKIGTYLKALAAKDNNIPFYIALPSTTFDFSIKNGLEEIKIESRSETELIIVQGMNRQGELIDCKIYPDGTKVSNYGFDVTPANLITGFITEKGIFKPDEISENLFI